MSKEDQILDLLGKMRADMDAMKTDIESLKKGTRHQQSLEEHQTNPKNCFMI